MVNKRDEVELCEAILAVIEKRRFETGDESLGAFVEETVLSHQIRELEAELLENPGAFERFLVPTHARRRAQPNEILSGTYKRSSAAIADGPMSLPQPPAGASIASGER